MTNHLLRKVNIANRTSKKNAAKKEGNATLEDLMGDQDYIRQSSGLIKDALEKGYDVLQLSNGDIVTTGTKVVVFRYSWDENTGKMEGRQVPVEEEEKKVEALLPEEELDDA